MKWKVSVIKGDMWYVICEYKNIASIDTYYVSNLSSMYTLKSTISPNMCFWDSKTEAINATRIAIVNFSKSVSNYKNSNSVSTYFYNYEYPNVKSIIKGDK